MLVERGRMSPLFGYLPFSDRLGCAGCPLLVCSNRQRDLLEGQDLTLASFNCQGSYPALL